MAFEVAQRAAADRRSWSERVRQHLQPEVLTYGEEQDVRFVTRGKVHAVLQRKRNLIASLGHRGRRRGLATATTHRVVFRQGTRARIGKKHVIHESRRIGGEESTRWLQGQCLRDPLAFW